MLLEFFKKKLIMIIILIKLYVIPLIRKALIQILILKKNNKY